MHAAVPDVCLAEPSTLKNSDAIVTVEADVVLFSRHQ